MQEFDQTHPMDLKEDEEKKEKEENAEESLVYSDFGDNKNTKNNNIEEKNNKLRNNKLKEERDHSTSVSSNPQISYSKSNNSTKDMCKKIDKNDDTPLQDENLLQITPHFWNENQNNKHSIQLKFNVNKNKKGKDNTKINKFERPLTPNLNFISNIYIFFNNSIISFDFISFFFNELNPSINFFRIIFFSLRNKGKFK